MIVSILNWLLHLIDTIGYLGIVILMTIESSFIPFPSEVVIPPAGYLAAQGKMNIILVIICGTIGSLLGAYINYFLAMKFGAKIFLKIGKIFGITEKELNKSEQFFNEHGAISTFTGRLLPVIRQYISIPAGIARMSHIKFIIYTVAGAGIWNIVLAFLGYFLGNNEKLIHEYSQKISGIVVIIVIVILAGYVIIYKWIKKRGK